MENTIKFHKNIDGINLGIEFELVGKEYNLEDTELQFMCRMDDGSNIAESTDNKFKIKEMLSLIDEIQLLLMNELEEDKKIKFNKGNIEFYLQSDMSYPVVVLKFNNDNEDSILLESENLREFLYCLKLFLFLTKGSKVCRTISNRPITYCGERSSSIIKPLDKESNLTLNELFEIFLETWERETAYPTSQKDPAFNIENDPSFGQCVVTAMVVQEYFGGDIYNMRTDDGASHYFNVINNEVIDMTKDQFDLYLLPLDYSKSKKVNETYLGTNANTSYRYKLLKNKVEEALKNRI